MKLSAAPSVDEGVQHLDVAFENQRILVRLAQEKRTLDLCQHEFCDLSRRHIRPERARLLALFEALLHRLRARPEHRAQRLPHRLVKGAGLLCEVSKGAAEFSCRRHPVRHEAVQEGVDPLPGLEVALDEGGFDGKQVELAHPEGEHLESELFLALEVVVEVALRYRGRLEDVLDARVVQAPAVDQVSGPGQDLLSAFDGACGGRSAIQM